MIKIGSLILRQLSSSLFVERQPIRFLAVLYLSRSCRKSSGKEVLLQSMLATAISSGKTTLT
jgi:hypothetical protein